MGSDSRSISIFSMFGELTGNTRSTPSPWLMRRTVNMSWIPAPLRAMTIPANIWTRSLSPSRTFVCTRTPSPTLKGGRSFFSWAEVISLMIGFMAVALFE